MKIENFADEFKFFKNIYQQINIADYVIFIGNENGIELSFSKDSSFYILRGNLNANCEFLNWIKKHNYKIKMPLSQINTLSKVLKKNMVSAEYDDETFTFTITEDDIEKVFEFKNQDYDEKYPIEKFNLTYTFDLNNEDLSKDVLEIFLDDDYKGTRESTNNKLIEMPTSKSNIKSLLKTVKEKQGTGKNKVDVEIEATNSLMYSDVNEYMQRYVAIKSEINCSSYNLKLYQISLTI